MDPLTIIPALLPALTDGIRGLIGRFTKGAGAKPQNIDEVIKLGQATYSDCKRSRNSTRRPGRFRYGLLISAQVRVTLLSRQSLSTASRSRLQTSTTLPSTMHSSSWQAHFSFCSVIVST